MGQPGLETQASLKGSIGGCHTAQTVAEERLQGYREALDAHGIAVDPDLIAVSYARVDGGEQGAARLLALEDRPSALFMMDGTMVIGALRTIASRGLR